VTLYETVLFSNMILACPALIDGDIVNAVGDLGVSVLGSQHAPLTLYCLPLSANDVNVDGRFSFGLGEEGAAVVGTSMVNSSSMLCPWSGSWSLW
jgi:hypothetical protein